MISVETITFPFLSVSYISTLGQVLVAEFLLLFLSQMSDNQVLKKETSVTI